MTTRQCIVFDSWPIMAYLQGEQPVDRIIEIIADAYDRGDSLLMSVVNAGEVWYSIANRSSTEAANSAIKIVQSLGIEFINVDWPTTQIAARYKAMGGIPYADCFAAALAKKQEASLVTGDIEFKSLESEITVDWLRM